MEGEPVDYKRFRHIPQLQSTNLILDPNSNKGTNNFFVLEDN